MCDDSLGKVGSILKFIGSTIDCFLTATLYVVVLLERKPQVLGSTIYRLFTYPVFFTDTLRFSTYPVFFTDTLRFFP